MFKIIIYLFFVTQICFAEDDNKKLRDDEIDITKPILVKDSPKFDDKSVPELDTKDVSKDLPKDLPKDLAKDLPKDLPKDISKDLPKDLPKDLAKDLPKDLPKDIPKDLPKDLPKDDNIPKPDINEKELVPKNTEEKLPDTFGTDLKPEKPVHNDPGVNYKDQEVDEKITKKVEKPLNSEPDFELGKDYKKVVVKPNKNEVPFGSFDPNDVDDSEKDLDEGNHKKPEKEFDGEEEKEHGTDKYNKFGPPRSKYDQKKEVQLANEIIDDLLKHIKIDYRSDFEQVKLDDFQPFKHGRWGSVKLHSGVVTGLANAERAGNVVVVDEFANKKLIVTDVKVTDVYADYKMNAKLFNRISFKDRELKLWLPKAVLNVKLEVDKNQKKLIIKEIHLKTFEGFQVKSGRLFWPFNKITNAILKNQEQVIKDLIMKEFDKYMGKVIHNIQFDEVFGKLF